MRRCCVAREVCRWGGGVTAEVGWYTLLPRVSYNGAADIMARRQLSNVLSVNLALLGSIALLGSTAGYCPLIAPSNTQQYCPPHYVDGVFQYGSLRASNVQPVKGTHCLHLQWTEAECFTAASGLLHADVRPGWMPIFSMSDCTAQRGATRYDDGNQPYIYGGQCDYVCGFCEHPCATNNEVSNLPAVAVDPMAYVFECETCRRGTVDLDGDTFTPCVPCVVGQYALEPFGCQTCDAGMLDHDLNIFTPCTPCPPGTRQTNSTFCTACEVGSYAGWGSSECTPCAAGSADHDTDPTSECMPCEQGHFAPSGSSVCIHCASIVYNGTHAPYVWDFVRNRSAIGRDKDEDPSTPCRPDVVRSLIGHAYLPVRAKSILGPAPADGWT